MRMKFLIAFSTIVLIGGYSSINGQKYFVFNKLGKKIFRESTLEYLCYIDCEKSFVSRAKRPAPAFCMIGDSAFIFPTFKDTLTIFSLDGKVIRNIPHNLNEFPTHLFYDSVQKKIYFMSCWTGRFWDNRVKSRMYLYTLSVLGQLLDSIVLDSTNIQNWYYKTNELDKAGVISIKKTFNSKKDKFWSGLVEEILLKNSIYCVDLVFEKYNVVLSRFEGSLGLHNEYGGYFPKSKPSFQFYNLRESNVYEYTFKTYLNAFSERSCPNNFFNGDTKRKRYTGYSYSSGDVYIMNETNGGFSLNRFKL